MAFFLSGLKLKAAMVPASASRPNSETGLPFTWGLEGVGTGVFVGCGACVGEGGGAGEGKGVGGGEAKPSCCVTFCMTPSKGNRFTPKTYMPYFAPTNPYVPKSAMAPMPIKSHMRFPASHANFFSSSSSTGSGIGDGFAASEPMAAAIVDAGPPCSEAGMKGRGGGVEGANPGRGGIWVVPIGVSWICRSPLCSPR